ncbi:MFS transporter [Phormidium sp. CLA17]|uniref:MFS transporter n=1 Tax=Leptolyngbya sp. Cla-17 TaxID=2803751 RepID=UPI0014927C2A|nr:MFS transporter [Leptolyngbya sp. Cla-17]MBM0742022.1 MFS transporter [Leptolyngbya sp. Cla-17]
MIQLTFLPMPLSINQLTQLWIAQVPVTPGTAAPLVAPSLFTGSHFFTALISGILLAFAMQLLLTNLSVAAGISYLGRSSSSNDHHSDSSSGSTVRTIGTGVGLWTLLTVTIALFIACWLAVQLGFLGVTRSDSNTDYVRLGAIIGLVIWAAYFTLLVWVSSSTVGSLVGSVVNAATSGFQSVLGAATSAIGSKMAQQQVISTAEAVAATVRNELGSAIDPNSIRESVESYVKGLPLPKFDTSQLRKDFEGILNDPEIAALAEGGGLGQVDRQTFVDLVSKRTDFSKSDVNRIADLLEGVWKQTIGQRSKRDPLAEVTEYLQSTQPGQLQIKELNAKLDQLLAAQRQPTPQQDAAPGGLKMTVQSGITTLAGLLAGRTDLSDLNVEQILNKLKLAPEKVVAQGSQAIAQIKGGGDSAYSPIRNDVEQYLQTKYSWQMNRETVEKEFREILFDPQADPGEIAQQLMQLNRSFFVDKLVARGVFTQDKIQQLADQLEATRRDVLAGALAAKEIEVETDLQERVNIYLTLTPLDQLRSNEPLPAFTALLRDDNTSADALTTRLSTYNRETLRQILLKRQDTMPEDLEPILNALESTRDRVLFDAKSVDEQAKQKMAESQQRLESYLKNTGKSELNPEGIKRDLQLLMNDPQSGFAALRSRASKMDRDTLVQLLRQRDDMNESEVNQVLDQVESNWNTFTHSPSILADNVKGKVDETQTAIADYLRRTNLEELNPEGIQRDLKTLLDDPKEGTLALRRRLSKIDRETLVQLLSQRQDLSKEQVNQTIDQVQEAIRGVIRSPRRLALRTQQRVMDFESTVEDYLRNTDKDELSPEGIKRDLALLTQSPKAGLQNLGDRLSRFDRSTLIALLSQRKDMTPEEAERVVAQVESTRDQLMDQMRLVQYRMQEVIDRIFGRVRDYLNSLDRPELNYESIKTDVRTLFDDPQAGFDALRNRLGHFDRGTLVAIMSSRDDISEADANRIIDQIEGARNNVLQRAEFVQTEVQRRLEDVKVQTQRQMEETRKAAATAAWWLFLTALVSAIASAYAGSLGAS